MKRPPSFSPLYLLIGTLLFVSLFAFWSTPAAAQGPPAPFCNGLEATIWVNDSGIIVGGPDAGGTYAGYLRGAAGAVAEVIVAPPLSIYSATTSEIDAFGGDDTICGSDNDDDIQGYGGNDYIDGGAGNDVIDGGGGNDTMLGGAGDDILVGGSGTDTADGGPDTDGCEADNIIPGGGPQSNCENDPTAITLSDLVIGTNGVDYLPLSLLVLFSVATLFVYRRNRFTER